MNKKYIIGAVAATMTLSINAQSYEDAVRFNANDPQGTARSQAMGSAFGALGADLTSMVINPGGVACYRASELAFTLGTNYTISNSNYYGFERSNDRINVPLDQFGGVINFGLEAKENGLISSSLGLSYSKLGNFTMSPTMKDAYGRNSYLDYFCTDGAKNDNYSGQLAYEAYLTNDTTFANGKKETYNVWESYFMDSDGNNKLDEDVRSDADGLGVIDHAQYVKQRGFKGEFTIAYALNISNIAHIGASMGIQTFDLSQKIMHSETNFAAANMSSFKYNTDFNQEGSGVNFKIGVIVKPFNFLRLGIAAHTPTFFEITEKWSSNIEGGRNYEESPIGEYSYNYRQPGLIVASAAGVVGQYAIVSIDYETSNYANGKFRVKSDDNYNSDVFDYTNDDVKDLLQRVHTIRVGAEGRLAEVFYVRAGYKQSTSPYKKDVMINEYKNQTVSGGLGYRNNNFYIDLAYVNQQTTQDFWVLPEADYPYETNLPAKIDNQRHNIVVTAGFRF